MVDREMNARKKAFGVELYDLIEVQQKTHKGDILKAPKFLKHVENEIKEPLEECTKDIRYIQNQFSEKEHAAFIIDAKREKEVNPTMGKRVSDTAKEAQLATQMHLLEREMKIRKEKFGLEIWDLVSGCKTQSSEGENDKRKSGLAAVRGSIRDLGKGVKGTVSKTLGKASNDEQDVEACVNKAKNDIALMQKNKDHKLQEIDRLSS